MDYSGDLLVIPCTHIAVGYWLHSSHGGGGSSRYCYVSSSCILGGNVLFLVYAEENLAV